MTTTPPAPGERSSRMISGGTYETGPGEEAEAGVRGCEFRSDSGILRECDQSAARRRRRAVRDAILDRVSTRPGTYSSRSASARDASRCIRPQGPRLLRCRSLGGHARRASREVDRRPGATRLACADAMALPFHPGVFDVVLLIPRDPPRRRPLTTLAEVRRVLRPNRQWSSISANGCRQDRAEKTR